jgi:hypothetical protein
MAQPVHFMDPEQLFIRKSRAGAPLQVPPLPGHAVPLPVPSQPHPQRKGPSGAGSGLESRQHMKAS